MFFLNIYELFFMMALLNLFDFVYRLLQTFLGKNGTKVYIGFRPTNLLGLPDTVQLPCIVYMKVISGKLLLFFLYHTPV